MERINTSFVLSFPPSLTTCILTASLGFYLIVVLSSNSGFASFDIVLHWLEFSHPPFSSLTFALLTLTKIPTVTSCLRGFYAQGGKHSPFQYGFLQPGPEYRVVQGAHREILRQEDSNQVGIKIAPSNQRHLTPLSILHYTENKKTRACVFFSDIIETLKEYEPASKWETLIKNLSLWFNICITESSG